MGGCLLITILLLYGYNGRIKLTFVRKKKRKESKYSFSHYRCQMKFIRKIISLHKKMVKIEEKMADFMTSIIIKAVEVICFISHI
jgi:hypothetical protein